MQESNPLISIVTVCYNSADTIARTLDSLRSQSDKRFESIVIDGGSTDATPDIVTQYGDVVTYFVSETDRGIYDAMNKGIRQAKGDYIAFLNSDDAYLDQTIAKVIGKIESSSSDVVYGNLIKERVFGNEVFTRVEKPVLENMEKTMSIFHPATFAKKELFDMHGGFDTRFKLAADYQWLLKVYLANSRFEYVDESLALFSVGGASNFSCESYREAAQFQSEFGLTSAAQMRELHSLCLKKQKRQRLIAMFANWPIIKQIYTRRLKKRWS